jgi:hypothetical protein
LIVVLWRAGLRIQEALALAEADLDYRRGALLVRRGKGGRRREVGMDTWGWDEVQPWLELRVGLPVGPLFCVVNGRTRGRQWSTAAARAELRRTAVAAGVRRRFAPHQLRHAHAVEMAREGVPLVIIQRQLGHSNLGITSVYLQGIDNAEIIDTVHTRRAPMIPVSTSLRLKPTRRRSSRIAALVVRLPRVLQAGESSSVRRARAGREEYERRSHGREGSGGVGVDREARAEGRYGGRRS